MRILSRHNINFGAKELWIATTGNSRKGAVQAFEASFSAYHGVRFALATGSGRAALYLALLSLRLPARTAVALPQYCFYTLPAVVEALGLKPVYVPVSRRTYAVDAAKLDQSLPRGTGALVIIHPFGQAAPMDAIVDICRRRAIPLIEDPSQSIGARYRGKVLGTLGRASAYSLVPGKNMTACGGGVLLTDDAQVAERARQALEGAPVAPEAVNKVRSAIVQWVMAHRLGFALSLYPLFRVLNRFDRQRLDALFEEAQIPFRPKHDLTRLSDVQAEIGLAQLKRLDALNAARRRNGEALLSALSGLHGIELPNVVAFCTPTFNAVAIRVPNATRVRQALLTYGVDSREDYMRWFDCGPQKRDDVLYLPNHPGLHTSDMKTVATALTLALQRIR